MLGLVWREISICDDYGVLRRVATRGVLLDVHGWIWSEIGLLTPVLSNYSVLFSGDVGCILQSIGSITTGGFEVLEGLLEGISK